MINYGSHYIDKNDIKAVNKVLRSKSLTNGKEVEQFEKSINKYFGCKGSAVVSSGTAALHLAGIILNWKKNDIILTVPNTFVATVNSIIYSGATPDLVDINPKTFSIDLDLLEQKIKIYKKNKKKIKSVIAVDYAGYPCDWKELKFLSNKYHFKLVNDNCHAIGSKFNNRLDYASKYADIVTHSYHPVKNITTGEGGALLSNDYEYINKAKLIRSHGLKYFKKNNKFKHYNLETLGFNYRINNFQCALGISQLKKLNKFVKKRRMIASIYDKVFNNFDCLQNIKELKKNKSSYHLYPLVIDFEKLKINKTSFLREMLKNNINIQSHYMPIHYHSYYKKFFRFSKNRYINSEQFYKSEVSLPIYYELTLSNAKRISEKIVRLLRLK
jgi:dTDP-4-amino-4,6-dideoxygalactose transaminase